MRRFWLYRDEDETGVSGTGPVAEGVLYTLGKVVLTWRTTSTSVAVYDDIETVEAIHGHGGRTRIVWLDPPRDPRRTHGAAYAEVPRDSVGDPIELGARVLPLKLLELEREPYTVNRCHRDDAGRWIVSSIGWPEHGYGSAAEFADRLRVLAPPEAGTSAPEIRPNIERALAKTTWPLKGLKLSKHEGAEAIHRFTLFVRSRMRS